MSAYFEIKEGVSLNGIQPEIVMGILLVAQAYASHGTGHVLTITSITDGVSWRKPGSLHLAGCAFDCRIWDWIEPSGKRKEAELKTLCERIEAILGQEFDVVLEDDHIHIELDVKD